MRTRYGLVIAAFAVLMFSAVADAQTVTRSGVQRENEFVRITFEERRYSGGEYDTYGIRWHGTNIGDRVMCARVQLRSFNGSSRTHDRGIRLERGARNVLLAEMRSNRNGSYGVDAHTLTWEPGYGGSPEDCSEAPAGYQ